MPGIALVRCDSIDQVVEDGDPCTVLCARLVMPTNKAERASGESEYRAVEWVNQPDDELPSLPRPGATVCLAPYPQGVSPTLIVGDCRLFLVWAGPVLFFFFLYVAEFDASGFLGKVFVVREI
jgi:hypothetical protein